MSIIITIIGIIFFAVVLNIVIIQSNNFIFMILRRPYIWIVFMGVLGFLYFFVGSLFSNSFEVVWWSALIAFLMNIPPSVKKDIGIDKKMMKKWINETYEELGITHGSLKYNFGLAAYVTGCVIGWVIFFGKIVVV